MKLFFENYVTSTRLCLTALFAGLFVLAACVGTVNNTNIFACANPFAKDCGAEGESARIMACSMADTGDLPCETRKASICTTNVFTRAVDDATVYICTDTAHVSARTQSLSYCRDVAVGDLEADPLCTNAVAGVCTGDKFDALCVADIYVNGRIADCSVADTGALPCADIITNICATNPFARATDDASYAICIDGDNVTTYAEARTTACLVPAVDESCTESADSRDILKTFNKATYATYLASETVPTTIANLSNATFLQSKEDGTGLIRTAGATGPLYNEVVVKLGDNPNSPDGFAVISFTTTNEPRATGYSGILIGTDLGRVLPSTKATAIWHGSIYTTGAVHDGVLPEVADDTFFRLPLTLELNFADGTITTTKPVVTGPTGSLVVNGVFGAHAAVAALPAGVLGGSVRSNLSGGVSNSRLTGLIGEQGVIGVFHGGFDPTNRFFNAGGFEASPTAPDEASYSDFVEHYLSQLPAVPATGGVNGFIHSDSAYSSGFSTRSITFVNDTDASCTEDDPCFEPFVVDLGGDGDIANTHGIVLMHGHYTIADADDEHRYRAGLLPVTNLGPVVSNTGTADWTGNAYVSRHLNESNEPIAVPLTLSVDFAAGTIGTTALTTAENETLTISGTFGATATLPAGILGGTVSYNDGTTAHSNLPLIGLIGTEGAIGVFHGGEAMNIVGGFGVSPTP